MWCTINLCICTKSNTPCRHWIIVLVQLCRHWIIVLEQMSTAAPRDRSSFFLEGMHLWCMCTHFRLYLLPSWSLLLGFCYTIHVTLFQIPCFWRAQESLSLILLNINLICDTAYALVPRCGKSPAGFSWRSCLKHAPPVEQLSHHMVWKHFTDGVPDLNLEIAEARHLNFMSSYTY